MRIEYAAPQYVSDVIAGIGRTEDIKFSPSNRRLAVACFDQLRILVFDISITPATDGPKISLTNAIEIFAEHLSQPHGIDFVDEETVAVANRPGSVCIIALPAAETGYKSHRLTLLTVLHSEDVELVRAPGSVSVIRKTHNECDLLVCNNFIHTVTRHTLRLEPTPAVGDHRLLLNRWLNIPDGICVSPEQRWIAISNHSSHNVVIYENTPALDVTSNPDGILLGVSCPHGLRFTQDGNYLFVADAGAPYVHVYGREGPDWRGVHRPLISWRVLDQDTYLRGRINPMEGGPKGIDIDDDMTVLAMTNQHQALAFFDVRSILKSAPLCRCSDRDEAAGSTRLREDDQNELAVKYELERQDELNQAVARADQAIERADAAEARADQMLMRADQAELRTAAVMSSTSWQATAPFRLASATLRMLRAQFSKK